MAEFLIKRIDVAHKDLVKDKCGCYKRGDVVQVYEDGECREPPSPNSKMYIIKVPGMSKEEAEKYTVSEIEETGDPENPTRVIRRRFYYFDFTRLSSMALSNLEADRELSITSIQARNYIKSKK